MRGWTNQFEISFGRGGLPVASAVERPRALTSAAPRNLAQPRATLRNQDREIRETNPPRPHSASTHTPAQQNLPKSYKTLQNRTLRGGKCETNPPAKPGDSSP